MNKLFSKDFFVTIASGIFIGAVIFEVVPEVGQKIGMANTLGLIALGVLIWWLLKKFIDLVAQSGLAVASSLAFWLHSFLEGSVVALGFTLGLKAGIIISLGMLLHLVPEFFAITAILRGEGLVMRKSVLVDLGGIAVLILSAFGLNWFFGSSLINQATIQILEAVSGGAFLYIGAASWLKRKKTKENILGLILGLIFIAIWRLVV